MVQKVVKEVAVAHPMEDIFEIEEGTTLVERVETIPTPLAPIQEYDVKDNEIEKQFQEVYDAAMTAFEITSESVQQVEPKFRARNEEVAVQYLTAALSAASQKAALKQHKDKVSITKVKATTPNTVNNNLIVSDRNELLKQILNKPKSE
jgi:hypothetical protein